MTNKFLIILVVFFCVSSCNEVEKKMSQELKDQVMQLHDQLMGKTEDIVKLKSGLDSLIKGKDSVNVFQLIHALDKADESMMDWMHQFSIDSLEKMNALDKISYLKKQLEALKNLDKSTDSSVHAAKMYTIK
jgi:GTP-binding protein EngB required for normal cell division